MKLYTALDCRKIWEEKCHNQWILTYIWKGNNLEWLGVHILKRSPQLAQNQEGTNYTWRIQHVIKMTFSRVLLAEGGSSSYILLPHYVNKKYNNDTTFSSGIIKKRKQKKTSFLFFCVSYTVLFQTFNILRLSAMSQMGHKPMSCRPALLPSSGSMQ